MLRYLISGHQFGFWIFASRQGPAVLKGSTRRLRGVPLALPPAVSTLPDSKGGRPSVVSEPPSDAEENQCLSHMVSMNLDTGLMPLSHRERSEPYYSEVRLILPELLASHLPDVYDKRVSSCAVQTVMSTQSCLVQRCVMKETAPKLVGLTQRVSSFVSHALPNLFYQPIRFLK